MTATTPTAPRALEALALATYGVPSSEIEDQAVIAKFRAAADEIATKPLLGNVVAIAELIARAEYDAEFATLNVFEVGWCSYSAREVTKLLS
ncbi:hypothetical protein FSY75_09335 [Streptomyces sp. TR1341]|uniref:hypothetical protein n=1 Tax=Streptomyces sp. TR1341 TaxID=2601266 RepID=UPI00138AD23A|nr:hypothetical protein [Streptomyces sp. TR1341]